MGFLGYFLNFRKKREISTRRMKTFNVGTHFPESRLAYAYHLI